MRTASVAEMILSTSVGSSNMTTWYIPLLFTSMPNRFSEILLPLLCYTYRLLFWLSDSSEGRASSYEFWASMDHALSRQRDSLNSPRLASRTWYGKFLIFWCFWKNQFIPNTTINDSTICPYIYIQALITRTSNSH